MTVEEMQQQVLTKEAEGIVQHILTKIEEAVASFRETYGVPPRTLVLWKGFFLYFSGGEDITEIPSLVIAGMRVVTTIKENVLEVY